MSADDACAREARLFQRLDMLEARLSRIERVATATGRWAIAGNGDAKRDHHLAIGAAIEPFDKEHRPDPRQATRSTFTPRYGGIRPGTPDDGR